MHAPVGNARKAILFLDPYVREMGILGPMGIFAGSVACDLPSYR